MSEALPALGPTARADVRAWFRATLSSSSGPLAATLPAPRAELDLLPRAFPGAASWIFAPPLGAATTTLGVAGAARLSSASSTPAADALLADLRGLAVRTHPDAPSFRPRAYFGLPFDEGAAPSGGLGAGALILPRWTYALGRDGASLTFLVLPSRPCTASGALAELDALLVALDAPPRIPPSPRVTRVEHTAGGDWTALVTAAQAAIGRGDFSKVVAARRTTVTADRPFDPLEVLGRLSAGPGTTRFLVRFGRRRAFVGATPEHLFTLEGNHLRTEALAGSIAANEPEGRLLESRKDREEHAHVVGHLVERLRTVGEVSVAPPEIRRLATVLHLRTPIDATLPRPVAPLDLVRLLHPTPAVCGTPTDAARAHIRAHEPSRGWYAGPLGWLDTAGHAEVVVSLRCALVEGEQAFCWAGGGIVAGSTPQAEWHESALKLGPMLAALGARP